MDDRIKKNTTAGRESRALQDASRTAPEENFVSSLTLSSSLLFIIFSLWFMFKRCLNGV